MTRISTLAAIFFAACMLASAQTSKTFTKDNLSFDYPEGWMVEDASTGDAQQFSVGKPNSDVQIRIFVHKGRISQEKLPVYLGFFQLVHNARRRGKALLGALIEGLVAEADPHHPETR